MKFIELFAGIGAFRLGLENTGHECVYANEWLDSPSKIYEKNFKHKPDTRDIRTIQGKDIPEADLICGGFPCATFSIAGKRSGFSLEDTRGTLCFEMFRLANEKRIPYILFENVKGLLNHDKGRTFRVILSALDEMGYDAQWELLNSKNFGVPQHRERIFLVANLRGRPRPKVFPIRSTKEKNSRKRKKDENRGKQIQQINNPNFSSNRVYDPRGLSPTLNSMTGGNRQPKIVCIDDGASPSFMSEMVEVSPTLKASRSNYALGILGKEKVRKLTPLECERLQGLPDNFTKYYADGSLVSDSERYERCGRTISIPVVEAIGSNLYEFYE